MQWFSRTTPGPAMPVNEREIKAGAMAFTEAVCGRYDRIREIP
jgi:hypothetical protein